MRSCVIDTPVGRAVARFESGRLIGLDVLADEVVIDPPAPARPGDRAAARLLSQMDEYFRGQRRSFDLPVEIRGTPFQRRVWDAMRQIPYGYTASYGDVAREVGAPRAHRAVGQAANRNPVWLIVPCHRVVAARGIGGYGGYLWRKEALLRLERHAQTPAASAAGSKTAADKL